MQLSLTLAAVFGVLLGFIVLNVIGPLVAVWDWLRSPDRVRIGR